MRNLRKDAKTGSLIVLAFLIVAQAFRIERTNPPAYAEVPADPAVKSLLKRACYNCHSNETVWPWYSGVAPASWMVGSDVKEGRQNLNFSAWGSYVGNDRLLKLRAIIREMQDGDMPPWYYSIVHGESRLNQRERDHIKTWAAAELDRMGSGKKPAGGDAK